MKRILVSLILLLFLSSSLVSAITTQKIDDVQDNILIKEDLYDLLIISYCNYAPYLEKLVNHKNSVDVETKLVTNCEIYNEKYFTSEGRDNPEKIKYFIKNAIEEWKIKYVLLVGNFKQIPVRYSHLESMYDTIPPEEGILCPETRIISDLYYADIYNETGGFCSWDSNENNIFGEWPEDDEIKDQVDLKPDIYLGRLACANKFEVKTVVKKIINYEKNTYGKNWFNNVIVLGSDSFNYITHGTNFDEGELITEKALTYLTDFNHIKFWFSNERLKDSRLWLVDFIETVNEGAGFIYFSGHSNPGAWTTHPDDDFEDWLPFFRNRHIPFLRNKEKLPIVIAECCHPSQFDVKIFDLNLFKEYHMIFRECWTWHMVRHPRGGSIASIGGTGYSITGISDYNENKVPDCIEIYDGWFNSHLFELYSEGEIDTLGELLGKAIIDYVESFPVYEDRYHCKVVEMKVLLGDPTLKIGGYEN